MASSSLLNNCKLTYFPIPGRGEATRLALTLGGISFEDERIPFAEWKVKKPTTPYGSMPLLTLEDGTVIAQQRAILRLVGKEVGLYPTDHLLAAKVDELMDAQEDIGSKVFYVGQGLEKEAFLEARKKSSIEPDGVIYQALSRLNNNLKADTKYAVSDELTIVDLMMFAGLSGLTSGMFDGVPENVLEPFPNLLKVRQGVKSHPTVEKYYSEKE
eukprot:CAMPEP_0168733956 /NCGR_PEP_ID=MMETSP0724-20121128/8563_1 /TAXON_ID=265536 /ORGANISM="Amphiprora sp., Strain CCMP467" /LENGTH=213 /DNA_ID=CAMNT_0008781041 /DNA_START=93 /DNA_END=734 /DNA_ORIENTATION=-